MEIKENISEGLRSIKSNTLRTMLTAAIIAIGITSLVGILTAIDALKASIDTSFSSLGANTFDIRRKRPDRTVERGKESKVYPILEYKDVTSFKEKYTESNITLFASVTGSAEVKYLSKKTNPDISVQAVDDNYMLIRDYPIADGRNFTENDIYYNTQAAIIGHSLKEELFDQEDPINKSISFRGKPFKVIGVLEEKGGFGGSNQADKQVFIPLGHALRLSESGQVDFRITANIKEPNRTSEIIGEATSIMRRVRGDKPGDEDSFDIQRNQTMEEELDQITGTLKLFGFIIGFITLLGASVGLMNIMLVSVTERTREIGVRKAVGATSAKIREQFLIEAIVICLLGGVAGVILGIISGNLLALIFDSNSFVAPWQWMIVGIIVCLITGSISGFYPAYKASKLDPIDSLRYE